MIDPVMAQYKPFRIIVKGEEKTNSIISCNKNGDRIDITYQDGSTYS
jgi:hypothetical protein